MLCGPTWRSHGRRTREVHVVGVSMHALELAKREVVLVARSGGPIGHGVPSELVLRRRATSPVTDGCWAPWMSMGDHPVGSSPRLYSKRMSS